MIEMLADELRLAVQQLQGSPSRLLEIVPLADATLREQVSGGNVYVYELLAHPTAKKCYAWATPSTTNSTIMHAVLQTEATNSPEAAVRSTRIAKRKAAAAYA